MSLTVNAATVNDAETISSLATTTFYETYAWYNTADNMQAYTMQHFNVEQTKRELQEPDTRFFLALLNGRAIGYAKMRNAEHPPALAGKRYLEIERIYILLQFRKLKAGYALMRKCLDEAREKKMDTVWLGVWEKNTAALAFYERTGFKKFGTHIFSLGNDDQKDYLLKCDLI